MAQIEWYDFYEDQLMTVLDFDAMVKKLKTDNQLIALTDYIEESTSQAEALNELTRDGLILVHIDGVLLEGEALAQHLCDMDAMVVKNRAFVELLRNEE